MSFKLRSTLYLAAFLLAAVPLAPARAQPVEAVPPLVSVAWLKDHLGRPNLLIVDIRAKEDFEAGHIAGAVNGSYPDAWRQSDWSLLSLPVLTRNLADLGVADDATVVVVPAGGDSTEFGGATFVYWVLKYLGHEETAILDGGWAAWRADPADPVAQGPSRPRRARLTVRPRPEIRATTDQVSRLLGTDTMFVDGRSAEQYLGRSKSPLVSRAGRLPGATNLPFASLYEDAAHRLKPASALAELIPPKLADRRAKIIAYCNTGHWSSIDWFVLHELLGYADARLYDGSMAEWTRDPHRPVESGEPTKN
jgi:thiosulfate/3-mercaptopyruvate sulfurtransferase